MNANTQIADKVIDRAAMVRLYERRTNAKIGVVLDAHEQRLDVLIKDAGLSVKQRMQLFDDVDKELMSTYREAYGISKRSLLDLFSDQVSYAYQNVEVALGKIWNTERPPKRIAEEVVLETPLYNNRTLAGGWTNISLGEKKRIEAVIRKGIAAGDSVDSIALDVRRGNVHNISRNQSKGLVVTAITSVTNQADHAVYKANSKAITGWQYVAVLDARTTPLCAHRDGHIFPIGDTAHLPPAHFYCRSTTTPVFKSWEDIASLEGVANVRRQNLKNLTKKQIAFYDGQTPAKESYNDWLLRQSQETQLKHIGDYNKLQLFKSGQLTLDKFTNAEGNSVGIKELRALSDSGYTPPSDTIRFASAKKQLDAMQLGAVRPEDFYTDPQLKKTLVDYYLLQAGELDGTLSITNYRGALLGTKKSMRTRVLTVPPNEDQIKFNPVTGRYEDTRLYQPNPAVHANNMRLLEESPDLKPVDIEFIKSIDTSLEQKMSINERAVVMDNLRAIFTRYRKNPEVWGNFKAIVQNQIKFDIMNVSDAMETQIRKDSNPLKKLLQDNYIDPVLGPVQLDTLHEDFLPNIRKKNKWEDFTAPKIANEMRQMFDRRIARYSPVIWKRISDREMQQFYLKFAHRLALADTPDKDQLAASLGRDLYNLANLNGSRREWFALGNVILESKNVEKFFELETFGVQKRRMKSRLSNNYFGPYYDTLSWNIRITDPRIQEYAQLTRKVDLGLRVSVTSDKNRLVIRPGFKTYFIDEGITGYADTRIPITSTSSFSDFPEELVDKSLADALNWAANSKYRIDEDYYDFIQKLLYFQDDKGRAEFFNDRNEYRKFILDRGDAYERFKAMEWLRASGKSFSNHPFVDHRARIYDRGLISAQSGETFRPFLNTEVEKAFSVNDFKNYQDQVGSFLGGLSDTLEGKHNSLSVTGRQKIAEQWRAEMVKIGNHMRRGKPQDIRDILESRMIGEIDGEEIGKFYRFAIETAKLDEFLGGNYTPANLERLKGYKTALALEQDASSSGAQIIALTTRNKQLAELSNVIPTNQKKRLYDEIAASTYNDPRFRTLNTKLGLTEKDLRKAAKAQNMVTLYGAGERTGIMNVEGKLAKVLGKETDTLVVKAADRDKVLNEISARIARYEKFDPETALELRQLRQDVKDVFNKGIDPGDSILDQLYFLDSTTRELVEKLSKHYDRIVTPDDFKLIANIMSEHLREQVPVLKGFTRFFGRLAEEYLTHAKPSNSDFDWKSIAKIALVGSKEKGYVLPDWFSRIFNLKPGEPVSEKILKRFGFWRPGGNLDQIINGVDSPEFRRTGAKYLKTELKVPAVDFKKFALGKEATLSEIELFYANKMPKSWTNAPWVNFDGSIVEQNFTQQFEERLAYKNDAGEWINNILQVPQKTDASWWDQMANKTGKINDIADATKARTAFAVNGNHSNDAVIVKQFHLWGKKHGIPTSTIHDAFFANAADMLKARQALREIYAKVLEKNVIKLTLDEMRSRGLPQEVYDRYLNEAIDTGLIPIPGRSKIDGKVMTIEDILTPEDILQEVPQDFRKDYSWYGVG